jgi:hypothetical protein
MTGVKGQKWKTTRPPKRRKVGIAIKQNLYEILEKEATKMGISPSRLIENIIVVHYAENGKL